MNIIDHISLTPAAADAWFLAAREAVNRLRKQGIQIPTEQVGTEEAHEQPDGSLIIQCVMGEHTVTLHVAPGDWCHAN